MNSITESGRDVKSTDNSQDTENAEPTECDFQDSDKSHHIPQPTERDFPFSPFELSHGQQVNRLRAHSVETVPPWLVTWPDISLAVQFANNRLFSYAYLYWYILVKVGGGLFGNVKNSLVLEHIHHHGIPGLGAEIKHVKALANGIFCETTLGRYGGSRPYTHPEVFKALGLTQKYTAKAIPSWCLEMDLDTFLAVQFHGTISHILWPTTREDLQKLTGLSAKIQLKLSKLITPPRRDGHVIVGEANMLVREIPESKWARGVLQDHKWQLRDYAMVRRTANSYISCHLPDIEIQPDGTVRTVETLDKFQSRKFFADEDAAQDMSLFSRDDSYVTFDYAIDYTAQGGRMPNDGWPSPPHEPEVEGKRPTLRAYLWRPGKISVC